MKRNSLVALFCLMAFAGNAQAYDTTSYVPAYYAKRLALFRGEPFIENKIIFLGNSITEFGNWRKLLRDSSVINRGIAGDITFGVLKRLDEVITRKPSKLFIKIGINDISKNIPDEVIVNNILVMVKRVRRDSPNTQVFIQSILPTNDAANEEYPDAVNKNDHVVNVNNQLMKYAKRSGYTYVNLYSLFANKNGKLDARYAVDGLHLNELGYQQWIKLVEDNNYIDSQRK